MIEKFIINRFYKWIGPQNFYENWATPMEKWKDGEARRCVSVGGLDGEKAFFNGIGNYYYGHCLKYFEETQNNTYKQEELDV